MFLNRLTEVQKKTFLAIALKVVGVDRHLDARERQMIEAMRYEMGLWQDTDIPKGDIADLAKAFDTHESRAIVLMETVALAYVDDDFAKEEEKMLRELALTFEFSEEEATGIENWVLRFRDLQKEALGLFEK